MIKIYKFDTDLQDFQEISQGTFDNPVTVKSTPGGLASAHKLWIRNDDPLKFYNTVSIDIPKEDAEAPGVINVGHRDTLVDFDLRMLSGDVEPTDAEWAAAAHWGTISSPLDVQHGNQSRTKIPDLGEAGAADTGFYPFWVKITTPGSITPGERLFYIRASYIEGVV